MLHDPTEALDPLADAEEGVVKNRAKVGSARPSSLLYTYGPGAIMDLPGFSVMPAGLDDWEPIWKRRRVHPDASSSPGCSTSYASTSARRSTRCVPSRGSRRRARMSTEGNDLGIPARVFPQWFRCTGCDYLGPLPRFTLHQHPPVPARPRTVHAQELPRPRRAASGLDRPQAREPGRPGPAPADLHQRAPRRVPVHAVGAPRRQVPEGRAARPEDARRQRRQERRLDDHLRLVRCEPRDGRSPGRCRSRQAPAEVPRPAPAPERVRRRLRRPPGADHDGRLEPVVRVHPVDHRHAAHRRRGEGSARRPAPRRTRRRAGPAVRRPDRRHPSAGDGQATSTCPAVTDDDLAAAVADVLAPADSEEERQEKLAAWDPVELLVPEWRYLQKPSLFPQQQNSSGLDGHRDAART